MRAVFSRRVIIALVSGLLTLAIVAGVALAFNLRSPQPGARSATVVPTQTPALTYSVTVTPTTSAPAPTHTPTTGKTTTTSTSATHTTSVISPPTAHGGRAPTSAPVASDTPTPTPTIPPAGASPTPDGSPTATPTNPPAPTATSPAPTATPTNPVDNATITGSSGSIYSSYGWDAIPLVVINTGTTTWNGGGHYYVTCLSVCLSGSPAVVGIVGPGGSATVSPMLFVTSPWTTATYHSKWSMSHDGVTFGEQVVITITSTVRKHLGTDPVPGCDNAGMTWSLTGGATCASGGLLLTTNSAHEPEALMLSGPSGFNEANFTATFHASFSATNIAWVRVA